MSTLMHFLTNFVRHNLFGTDVFLLLLFNAKAKSHPPAKVDDCDLKIKSLLKLPFHQGRKTVAAVNLIENKLVSLLLVTDPYLLANIFLEYPFEHLLERLF